jgi:hypothetical protein
MAMADVAAVLLLLVQLTALVQRDGTGGWFDGTFHGCRGGPWFGAKLGGSRRASFTSFLPPPLCPLTTDAVLTDAGQQWHLLLYTVFALFPQILLSFLVSAFLRTKFDLWRK